MGGLVVSGGIENGVQRMSIFSESIFGNRCGLKKRAVALSACVPLLECNAAYARGGHCAGGGAVRIVTGARGNRIYFWKSMRGGLKKRDVAMALSACVPLLECNAAYARGGAVRIITKGHAAIEWNGLCARGVACSPRMKLLF